MDRHISFTFNFTKHYLDKETHEVWEELRERFSQGNLFRLVELQESLANFKQGELSVNNYFTEIKTLWDEIENLRPLPICNCANPPKCTAEIGTKKHCDEDRVIRFSKGLNDVYSRVRSQIMLIEPLPNISKVFSMVIQQETQLYGQDLEVKAMAVAWNWRRGGSSNRGFFLGRKSSNSIGRANFQFTKGEQVNSIRTNEETQKEEPQTNNKKTDQDNTICKLSQQQYHGLINMLQQNNPMGSTTNHDDHKVGNVSNILSTASMHHEEENSGTSKLNYQNTSWILDSGATDHICSTLSLFSAYYRIKPILVKLPNGSQVVAKISRTIPILQNLILHNVLYLPYFSYNLLSIPRLAMDISCIICFNESSREIQDNNTLKMIGTTRIIKGLYVLKPAIFHHKANSSFTQEPNISNTEL
ncbi:PREDICTED: uncharacterized protein LOC109327712 [Lupinus angustifolius]|uniref:uncharacterized protein LOC109327712 n=1 Tax=Lupinus angustifolius TaxID=3871 RepID=UPI00092E2FDA|nr:PREDICTED: uncharacterized protein LOC109327712 [Lupinus angustifolius]